MGNSLASLALGPSIYSCEHMLLESLIPRTPTINQQLLLRYLSMTYGKKIMVTLDNATRHDWFSPSDQPRTTGGFVADAGPPCYDETNMEDPEIGSGSVHPMTLEVNLEATSTDPPWHSNNGVEAELQIGNTPTLTLRLQQIVLRRYKV